MIEIKPRPREKNAFEITGRFADASAHTALLQAVSALPFARLYMRGLRSGNSTALSHFVWGLRDNEYPPLTFCEVSDYWLRCLNLVPQMLRPQDAVESMLLQLACDSDDREEILYVGKDIPLLETYEGFEFRKVIDGREYQLGVHFSAFTVLARMTDFAKKPARSAS